MIWGMLVGAGLVIVSGLIGFFAGFTFAVVAAGSSESRAEVTNKN